MLIRGFRYRLWVLQESALCPAVPLVYIGALSCPFDLFAVPFDYEARQFWLNMPGDSLSLAALQMIRMVSVKVTNTLRNMNTFQRTRYEIAQKGKMSWFDIVADLVAFECTEPRDRIYGILGMVDNIGNFQLDYNRTIRELYATVTYLLMRHTGTLALLMCEVSIPEGYGISFWCGNWADATAANRIWRFPKKIASTSWDCEPPDWSAVLLFAEQGMLRVPANTTEKTKHCLSIYPRQEGLNIRNAARAILTWWEELGKIESELDGPLDVLVFVRTFMRECWHPREGDGLVAEMLPPDSSEYLDRPHCEHIFRELQVLSVSEDPDPMPSTLHFGMTIAGWASNSRMFVTEQGRLAIGPATLEISDTLWHVEGCYAPLAMRPARDRFGKVWPMWQLVGACHVDGRMGGIGLDRTRLEMIELI